LLSDFASIRLTAYFDAGRHVVRDQLSRALPFFSAVFGGIIAPSYPVKRARDLSFLSGG